MTIVSSQCNLTWTSVLPVVNKIKCCVFKAAGFGMPNGYVTQHLCPGQSELYVNNVMDEPEMLDCTRFYHLACLESDQTSVITGVIVTCNCR